MAAAMRIKQRKEEILRIKQLTKSFKNDPKNANNILDVLAGLESDDTGLVIASINATTDIFTHLLERGNMHLKNPRTEHEHLLDRTVEEKYKLWLQEHYDRATTRLLDFVVSAKQKVQDLSLKALMKFVSLEGSRPLQNISKDKFYFPIHILERIITGLLSDAIDMKNVIARFQEYLDYSDVKFNFLKIMKNTMKIAKTKEPNSVYLDNCFSLMKMLIFMADAESNMSSENFCKREGASIFRFEPNIAKKIFGSMWLSFLKLKLPGPLYRRVLLCMDEKILPCMESPLLMTDFLMDSYNIGGVTSLLALNGLFVLMLKYNLEFPDFYKNLYALMEPSVFFTKYRARFFFLADIFLTSSHLPEYLAAAFAKRLARIALQAPPHCLVLVIHFIQNLFFRHPGLIKLIHDPQNNNDLSTDPFLANEPDPAKCKAMESSLWEIKTLQLHYHPQVSLAAKFIEKPLRKSEVDLGEYLELTTTEMIEEESKRKAKKTVPLTHVRPKGLFGGESNAMSELWTL